MNIQTLQALVIDALEDVKAQDIRLFDTMHLTSMFERLAIASGTSNRQTRALAASVVDKVKQAGGHVAGMEGEDTGEWVLVDLGDMVVHIMQAPIRAYYRLEELWGERPIDLAEAKKAAKAKAAKPAKAAKGTAKDGAGDDSADPASEAAKPKRTRTPKRSDSATEALEKPKKTRSAAAPAEGEAAAPRRRTRTSTATSSEAAAPAPRTPRAPRARTTAASGDAPAAPKPRTRKPKSSE